MSHLPHKMAASMHKHGEPDRFYHGVVINSVHLPQQSNATQQLIGRVAVEMHKTSGFLRSVRVDLYPIGPKYRRVKGKHKQYQIGLKALGDESQPCSALQPLWRHLLGPPLESVMRAFACMRAETNMRARSGAVQVCSGGGGGERQFVTHNHQQDQGNPGLRSPQPQGMRTPQIIRRQSQPDVTHILATRCTIAAQNVRIVRQRGRICYRPAAAPRGRSRAQLRRAAPWWLAAAPSAPPTPPGRSPPAPCQRKAPHGVSARHCHSPGTDAIHSRPRLYGGLVCTEAVAC